MGRGQAATEVTDGFVRVMGTRRGTDKAGEPCYRDKDGNVIYHLAGRPDVRHREDGPAVEEADGSRLWYRNGKLHREDGPAIERAYGRREWYQNGKRHREDGPAVEGSNGSRLWYRDGKLHREDGPAVEEADGSREWWLEGVQYRQEAFNAKVVTAGR